MGDRAHGVRRWDTTLVLIGDPKQAIYAFRGADVYAYLDAANSATTRATLGINWRSDQALIDAYDALMGGARLGHAGIEYRTVRAADDHQQPRLIGAPEPAALRVRVLHRDDGLVPLTNTGVGLESIRRAGSSPPTWPATSLPCSRPDAEIVVHRSEETDLSRSKRCVPDTSPSSSAATATPRPSATPSTRPASPP